MPSTGVIGGAARAVPVMGRVCVAAESGTMMVACQARALPGPRGGCQHPRVRGCPPPDRGKRNTELARAGTFAQNHPRGPCRKAMLVATSEGDGDQGVDAGAPQIRVMIADDTSLIREALDQIVGDSEHIVIAGIFGDRDALLKAIDASPPD